MKLIDKVKSMAIITATIMDDPDISLTSYEVSSPKQFTMSDKKWKKRKRRLEMAKASRRANR
jgi:hypothetical protein